MPRWVAMLVTVVAMIPPARGAEEEVVGERPYEMVWANRTEDDHPALIDFEELDGWRVECVDSDASFVRSREQQLWGRYVGKLVYRGTGKQPSLVVKPPRGIPLPQPFDCLNFWIYGNNWAWVSDKTTPQVDVAVMVRNAGGQSVRLPLGRVRWKEWWVMHLKLSPEQTALLKDGAVLEGIEISGGRNTDDRTLYFDNLSVYQEQLPPLQFKPRPERNLTLFPGQTAGTNTGPGRLPFPTREETILPDNLAAGFEVRLEEKDGVYSFHYEGEDGHLMYRYRPATGTLGDVVAQWEGRGEPFQPMTEGGLYFAVGGSEKVVPAEKLQLVSCRRQGDAVESVWRCTVGGRQFEAKYTFRLWQKSLVVDVECRGGEVGEFRVGRAVGVENPRLATLPYLACESQRPAVMVLGPVERPLFVFSMVDFYRSNASSLWAANQVGEEGVIYNGGSRYTPKTDGRRNDCFERLFLTVSPRFEEVLPPNVANPKSPWISRSGERCGLRTGLRTATKTTLLEEDRACADQDRDYRSRDRLARRRGKLYDANPRRAEQGRRRGQAEYARKIRALGFRYGIYNNYTDFAPVNEHWDEDYVTRTPAGIEPPGPAATTSRRGPWSSKRNSR